MDNRMRLGADCPGFGTTFGFWAEPDQRVPCTMQAIFEFVPNIAPKTGA